MPARHSYTATDIIYTIYTTVATDTNATATTTLYTPTT